jgi:hypothetical protein
LPDVSNNWTCLNSIPFLLSQSILIEFLCSELSHHPSTQICRVLSSLIVKQFLGAWQLNLSTDASIGQVKHFLVSTAVNDDDNESVIEGVNVAPDVYGGADPPTIEAPYSHALQILHDEERAGAEQRWCGSLFCPRIVGYKVRRGRERSLERNTRFRRAMKWLPHHYWM